TMVMALAGQTVTHSPQPMQSSGETAMTNLYSLAGLLSRYLVCLGAAASSSAVSWKGRMVACEQTKAHWLQPTHLAASHSGTVTAVPRFSYAEAPCSHWPLALWAKAETGRLSPSMRAMGSITSRICLSSSGRPASSLGAGSASGLDQLAGTSTLWMASTPASMAFQFISTTSWPFLP